MQTSPILKARELDVQLRAMPIWSLGRGFPWRCLLGDMIWWAIPSGEEFVAMEIATFSTLRSPHLSPNTLQGGEVGSQARAGLCFVPGASLLPADGLCTKQ